jgi:uncharacterized membrane protein
VAMISTHDGSIPETLSSNSKEISTSAVSKKPRYGFIDLLRGFAIVMMVETHVVNAYLPLAWKKGFGFFFWLAFLNGLVAPSFLFATGFSLILQSKHQWENWIHFRRPFWKQMRRIGFITLVAYYTHLQWFGVRWYLKSWNDARMWDRTFQSDILQCIVVSLLILLAIILIFRSKKLLPWITGTLALGMALATPWIWTFDFREKLPLPIALILNPHHGISIFPIFPWMSCVLAGAFAAHFFLKAADAGKIAKYMQITAYLGSLMVVAGLLLRNVSFTLPGVSDFYTTSPLYLMIRLGCVLLICAILYNHEAKARWMQPIQLAGQESLLVYGVHLWVIFACLRGKILGPILGKQFGYFGCFAISIAIIILMLYLAKHWHALKKHYPRQTRLSQAGIVIVMVIVFLLT